MRCSNSLRAHVVVHQDRAPLAQARHRPAQPRIGENSARLRAARRPSASRAATSSSAAPCTIVDLHEPPAPWTGLTWIAHQQPAERGRQPRPGAPRSAPARCARAQRNRLRRRRRRARLRLRRRRVHPLVFRVEIALQESARRPPSRPPPGACPRARRPRQRPFGGARGQALVPEHHLRAARRGEPARRACARAAPTRPRGRRGAAAGRPPARSTSSRATSAATSRTTCSAPRTVTAVSGEANLPALDRKRETDAPGAGIDAEHAHVRVIAERRTRWGEREYGYRDSSRTGTLAAC